MILKGSMSYDQHGRKRKNRLKTKRKSSNRSGQWVRLQVQDHTLPSSPSIPSAEPSPYRPAEDTSYKKEVSKNYTVSIAYNKGAYQVIPKDDVEHIGK